jgi:gluconokinase
MMGGVVHYAPWCRRPWLARLAVLLGSHPRCILACSALKRSYRRQLLEELRPGQALLVFLRPAPGVLKDRLQARQGHYFKVPLHSL